MKPKERYCLESTKLVEIIKKIDGTKKEKMSESVSMHLRQNGIQIYVPSESDDGLSKTSLPLGMIVSGVHLNEDPTNLYLVTFEIIDKKEYRGFRAKYNLIDILRDYII